MPFSAPLIGHDGRVRAVAFTSHGSLLASAGLDGTIRLWNTPDSAPPTALGSSLTGHNGTVYRDLSAGVTGRSEVELGVVVSKPGQQRGRGHI
jgi:WD40 repeat protein